jgi:hypothetical protein
MEFHSCCCRSAVKHFGQKTAGSPPTCVVLCLLHLGVMHAPAAGERRGASRRSLLGVAWVNDCVFYRWTVTSTSMRFACQFSTGYESQRAGCE